MENLIAQETQLNNQPATINSNLLPKPDEDAATFIIMPITEVEPASLVDMKTESETSDNGLITEHITEIDHEKSSRMTDVTEGSVDFSAKYTYSQTENTYSTESITSDCSLITKSNNTEIDEVDIECPSISSIRDGSVGLPVTVRYTYSQAEKAYSCVQCSYKSAFLLGINRH